MAIEHRREPSRLECVTAVTDQAPSLESEQYLHLFAKHAKSLICNMVSVPVMNFGSVPGTKTTICPLGGLQPVRSDYRVYSTSIKTYIDRITAFDREQEMERGLLSLVIKSQMQIL